ncbi:uncharacterized protein LOC127748466 [Arachis duranensis]|uniref:Uncharacterized protein LOC127748466 n=1 Tax=Arachis duranensis TaxID=130453 RepID=A0A9C6WUX6_ARADU|nr:uncharacterized protein LOC127748466 [Arachis duranensis]
MTLTKYKTATEAWQLITDLAESTRSTGQRTNHPKAVAEVSASSETATLTKTLREMTNILSSSVLPSQPLPNPKGGINAITLRSRTTLQERSPEEPSSREDIQVEDVVEVEDVEEEDEVQDAVEKEVAQSRNGVPNGDDAVREFIPIPFRHLARRTKKQVELDPKMVEIFKRVEVTIPLFDAIYQVPKYAKFLKDLCMHKDKIHDVETIPLGSSISALMGAIPEKCGDPGPYKSVISVVGIVEDVLVTIKGLKFPIDFYILEMPPSDSGIPSSILLGRPFLKTLRFKLDAFSGTYSFEINRRAVSFNLDKAMKHPPEDHSIFQCDIIDEIVAEVPKKAVEEETMEQVFKYLDWALWPLLKLVGSGH